MNFSKLVLFWTETRCRFSGLIYNTNIFSWASRCTNLSHVVGPNRNLPTNLGRMQRIHLGLSFLCSGCSTNIIGKTFYYWGFASNKFSQSSLCEIWKVFYIETTDEMKNLLKWEHFFTLSLSAINIPNVKAKVRKGLNDWQKFTRTRLDQ